MHLDKIGRAVVGTAFAQTEPRALEVLIVVVAVTGYPVFASLFPVSAKSSANPSPLAAHRLRIRPAETG